MKKTKRNSRATQNKKDEMFAQKVIGQFIMCFVIFVVVFVNSRLSNSFSRQINDSIKHHLNASIDFDKVINTTIVYFENYMKNKQSVPANTSDVTNSKENN